MIHGTLDAARASISVTDTGLTASRGDRFVVAWDRGGRLYSVFDAGVTSRRGLNGRVLVKWRDEHGERQRRWATEAESRKLVETSSAFAWRLAEVLRGQLPAGAESILARAARFNPDRAREDVEEFARVYRPIGILPPDQYLSLVLQATEGCSFSSCTFCDFYRDPYRVRTAPDFAAHVAAVRHFLGDSIHLRRRAIFLGSANALAVPTQTLLPIFDVVDAEFPGCPVHAFVDGFTGAVKTSADYRALGKRGLRRVYVGLESGHQRLLEFVRKPATVAQAIETVRTIKEASVAVGVIAMIGLGGDRFSEAHIHGTAGAINEMRLGEGDLLYFSELVEEPGNAYARTTAATGIRPLTASERALQRIEIERRLSFPGPPPRIASYDIREFVY